MNTGNTFEYLTALVSQAEHNARLRELPRCTQTGNLAMPNDGECLSLALEYCDKHGSCCEFHAELCRKQGCTVERMP